MENLPELIGHNPIWLTALIAVGSAVSGWFINVWKQCKSDNREDIALNNSKQLSENSLAFDIYKEIIKGLMEDRERLQKHLIESEKEHMDCRESHGELSKEVEFLKQELIEIRIEFQEYKRLHNIIKQEVS